MTTRLRITYLMIAVLIAVAAAVVLGTRGTDRDASPASPAATTREPTVSAATPSADATPIPRRRGPLLTAGSERTLEVTQGETVTFRVRHDTDEEVHVHGYDISRELPAGKTVPVSFKATIPGIFEVELEGSGVLLACLEVRP